MFYHTNNNLKLECYYKFTPNWRGFSNEENPNVRFQGQLPSEGQGFVVVVDFQLTLSFLVVEMEDRRHRFRGAEGRKTDAFTWPSLLRHFLKLPNLSPWEQPLLQWSNQLHRRKPSLSRNETAEGQACFTDRHWSLPVWFWAINFLDAVSKSYFDTSERHRV